MNGSIKSYIIGFFLSVILTLMAYFPVSLKVNSGESVFPVEILLAWILSLAVMQLFVQLIFFLHLGNKKSPKWNLVFFIGTIGIVIMIVIGSIWIMYNLNYNMLPNVEDYLIQNEGANHNVHQGPKQLHD